MRLDMSDPPVFPPTSPDAPVPGQPPLPGQDAPSVEIPPGDIPVPVPPAVPM